MIKAIDNLFADFVPSSIHHSDISGLSAPSSTAQALHIDRIEVSTPQFLTNQEAEEGLAMVRENVTTSPTLPRYTSKAHGEGRCECSNKYHRG